MAYTGNRDFQRSMVRKYIFQLIVHKLRRFHKQRFHIYAYIGRWYRLDYRRMDELLSIDRLHKHRPGTDFLINLVGTYTLDHRVLQYKQLLGHRSNRYTLQKTNSLFLLEHSKMCKEN